MSERSIVRVVIVLALVGLSSSSRAGGEAVPEWLLEAARAEIGALPSGSPAIVLLDERTTTVRADGSTRASGRRAIRILAQPGAAEAVIVVPYHRDTATLRSMRAWLLPEGGAPVVLAPKDVVDVASGLDALRFDAGVKILSAADIARPGSVFGGEWLLEDRAVFTQTTFAFQQRLPVRVARLAVTVPPDWSVEGVMFNRAPVAPAISATTFTWELRDLPFLRDEPRSPGIHAIAPWIGVGWMAGAGAAPDSGSSFRTWNEVGSWLSSLAEPAALPDPAVEARARALVASAPTFMERVRAIGRHVQDVRYVAIEIGLGGGGGYRPHAAPAVLANAYGDCKDKVALMRSLLRSLGIRSHAVFVHAGGPGRVQSAWPSPQQFNHCIVALEAPADVEADAVGLAEGIGRVLFFDPTDPLTPLGALPRAEQGALGLIAHPNGGALVPLPSAPADSNLVRRDVVIRVGLLGSMGATLREASSGVFARHERELRSASSEREYRADLEAWIAGSVGGASIGRIEVRDDPVGGTFTLDLDASGMKARQIGGRLLMARPILFSARRSAAIDCGARRLPIALAPESERDVVRIELEEGLSVAELPEAVRLDSVAGEYSLAARTEGRHVVVERRLVVREGLVASDGCAAVAAFFAGVVQADQVPVLLARE